MKTLLAVLATTAVVAGAGLFWVGAYDVSATDEHLAPTYWFLDRVMRRSVNARARQIDVPPLDDIARMERGIALFRDHCVQCHGGPGVAPQLFALGLVPAPANLVHTAREWRAAELFWVIKHGIKMTGMPAWAFRMSDDDIWAIVAFLRVLPALAPDDYERLVARIPSPAKLPSVEDDARSFARDAARGRRALGQYLCITCHVIPGVVGTHAPVGPPLSGIATRKFIAGVLPNTPNNLVQWLRAPQAISPHNAMPDLGVSERDAQDIAAYLSTLR